MDLSTISYSTVYIQTITMLIVFISGIIYFIRRPFYQKLLCIFAGVSFFCDATMAFSRLNFPGNFWRIAEFALLMMIFYSELKRPEWKKYFIIAALIFIIIFIGNITLYAQESILSYTNTFSAVIFIVLAVLYFYRLMVDMPTHSIQKSAMFWTASGVLLYFAGNLILFSMFYYLTDDIDQLSTRKLFVYWGVHNSFGILRNILFIIGLWQKIPISRSL